MVVPMPTALPWTAATIGTSFFASARSSRQTGMSAGCEILARALERDQPYVAILGRTFDRIGQRGIHGHGNRVAALRPVHPDLHPPALPLDLNMLAHRPALRMG
jgi:hypothetical protein